MSDGISANAASDGIRSDGIRDARSVQVRSRLITGVLFEYVPDRRVVRIGRRGLMFEVSVDQLAACDDGVLMLWPALHSGPPGCVPILEVAATQSQCDAHDI